LVEIEVEAGSDCSAAVAHRPGHYEKSPRRLGLVLPATSALLTAVSGELTFRLSPVWCQSCVPAPR
jgi:hypothetical protein